MSITWLHLIRAILIGGTFGALFPKQPESIILTIIVIIIVFIGDAIATKQIKGE